MTLVSFENLFQISDPVANRPFRASIDCTIDEAVDFSRAESRPTKAVALTWRMGSSLPSDIVWTLLGLPVIVSSRFVDVLRDFGFSGWDTYPVSVTAKDGRIVAGFYGLAITGRCDPPDLSRSELVLRQYPGGWFPVLRGSFFPPESWDGTDFFMERADERGNRPSSRYVTGRVLRAFRRSRFSNLRVEKLSELEVSTSVYEIGLRYRLPKDFDARVSALYAAKGTSGNVSL